jgi:putative hydrolase of the HAD superfamily
MPPLLSANVRAVFFDAVGTVLHPDPGAPIIYAEAAARFGLPADPAAILARFRDAFLHQERIDERADWVTSEAREIERWQAIVAETLPGAPPECFELLYQHFAHPDAWQTPPGAAEVFEHLRERGLLLGLASNYDSRLESVLVGHPELARLREHIVISSQIGVRKPGSGFFHQLIESTSCRPEEIVLVGDDIGNDYEGARAAGLKAILLDPKARHPGIAPRITSLRKLIAMVD